MKMMNFCKLLFAVLLFLFATFKLFFRHSFTTFFWRKNKLKNGIWHADYLTRKLKWKFDIRDSWLVTLLVREPCQKPLPTPPPPSTRKTFSSINSEIRIVWGSSINRRKKFNFNDRSNQIEKFFTIENDPEKLASSVEVVLLLLLLLLQSNKYPVQRQAFINQINRIIPDFDKK